MYLIAGLCLKKKAVREGSPERTRLQQLQVKSALLQQQVHQEQQQEPPMSPSTSLGQQSGHHQSGHHQSSEIV